MFDTESNRIFEYYYPDFTKNHILFYIMLIVVIHVLFSLIKVLKNTRKKNINYKSVVNRIRFLCFEIVIIVTLSVMWFPTYVITEDMCNELSYQIEEISNNLAKSSDELSNVQRQLEKRIEYVENLKEEAKIAENILNLSEDQVMAIQSNLNNELEANSNKSLIQSILISAFFFILGLFIQPILKIIMRKFNKHPKDKFSSS